MNASKLISSVISQGCGLACLLIIWGVHVKDIPIIDFVLGVLAFRAFEKIGHLIYTEM